MELNVKEIATNVELIGKNYEELKAMVEKGAKEKDYLIDEKLKKLTEEAANLHADTKARLDAIEAKAQRPPAAASTDADPSTELFNKSRHDVQFNVSGRAYVEVSKEEAENYRKVFLKYTRQGDKLLGPEEHKTMSVGSDPDGGYWILPPTMASKIVERIFETSPVRQLADAITIGTREYVVPQDPNEVNAGWTSETAARTASTTPQVARKTIEAQEMYSEPTVTQQMMEDWQVDVEKYLTKKISGKFARLEATAFVAGTGVGQPRGFTTYASGTTWGTIQQVGSGTSGAFTYTGLVNIITSIKDEYQANAAFLIKRASIASIMLLTDGSSRLIFQPLLNGDFNKTPLLGYPINYANDMPAVGAGALSLAFGDFKAGYQIVDRVGMSTIRDNITSKGNVLFYTRKRVGGDVIDFDAIKLQVLT